MSFYIIAYAVCHLFLFQLQLFVINFANIQRRQRRRRQRRIQRRRQRSQRIRRTITNPKYFFFQIRSEDSTLQNFKTSVHQFTNS